MHYHTGGIWNKPKEPYKKAEFMEIRDHMFIFLDQNDRPLIPCMSKRNPLFINVIPIVPVASDINPDQKKAICHFFNLLENLSDHTATE